MRRYRVHYGSHLSYSDFASWTAACRFMRDLLLDGYKVSVSLLHEQEDK